MRARRSHSAPARAAGLALALAGAAALAGCGRSTAPADTPPPEVRPPSRETVEQLRQQKREFLRHDEASPLPPDVAAWWDGPFFYPFDPTWQYVVRVEPYDEPVPLRMITTEGEERPAVRWGQLAFERDGRRFTLQVYRLRDVSEAEWDEPFLPFGSTTDGTETYPAGRYVELAGGRDGWYVLDFNLAYNPSCAYGGSGFACPQTPPENRLDIAVRAGERDWVRRDEAPAETAGAGGAGGER